VVRPVPASVVRLYASSERHDVYDLTVADAHEFVAAGVIVHNCVWALTELTDNFSADAWIAWAKRKAEEAAGRQEEPVNGTPPAAEKPDPEPAEPLNPAEARQRARNAAFLAARR
jgi:hypothetical protein